MVCCTYVNYIYTYIVYFILYIRNYLPKYGLTRVIYKQQEFTNVGIGALKIDWLRLKNINYFKATLGKGFWHGLAMLARADNPDCAIL